MSATHLAWGSIALLHNVIKTQQLIHERTGQPLPRVTYRAKVKLHGTNCAIQRTSEGVVAQSRKKLLCDGRDYKGFAAWVAANESCFNQLAPNHTVFGEWCGPGIEKGMAISKIDRKVFAVFAIQVGEGDAATLITEPEAIREQLPQHPDVFVLPWCAEPLELDYAGELSQAAAVINALVLAVEREDPWVRATFGVRGIGEGVVMYPLESGLTPARFSQVGFKAKGDKHRTVASRQAAQVKPEAAESVAAFVQLVVTEGRLLQGASEVGEGTCSMKHMGRFIQWIEADVRKECGAEIEAASLTWRAVTKAIRDRARTWYKDHVMKSQ
ncbi:MAG: RNA ligase family protein [Nannocystaceae bacterium]